MGVGSKASASDYNNGDATPSPPSAVDLKMAEEFVTFSEACAIMTEPNGYKMSGEPCTTSAKFICMKQCKYNTIP